MMFEYLTNYGVKKHTVNHEDLDVNDRLALEGQINKTRKAYSELLELLDDVQGKYLMCSSKISKRCKELMTQSAETGTRANMLFDMDDDYIQLQAEQQALKSGISMINEQMDFCKNDLRILNSVFYNKF